MDQHGPPYPNANDDHAEHQVYAPPLGGAFATPDRPLLPHGSFQQSFPNAMRLGGSPPYLFHPAQYANLLIHPDEDFFDENAPPVQASGTLTDDVFQPGEQSVILRSAEEGWLGSNSESRAHWDTILSTSGIHRPPNVYRSRRSWGHAISRSPSLGRAPEFSDSSISGRSRSPSLASSGHHDFTARPVHDDSGTQNRIQPAFLHPSSRFGAEVLASEYLEETPRTSLPSYQPSVPFREADRAHARDRTVTPVAGPSNEHGSPRLNVSLLPPLGGSVMGAERHVEHPAVVSGSSADGHRLESSHMDGLPGENPPVTAQIIECTDGTLMFNPITHENNTEFSGDTDANAPSGDPGNPVNPSSATAPPVMTGNPLPESHSSVTADLPPQLHDRPLQQPHCASGNRDYPEKADNVEEDGEPEDDWQMTPRRRASKKAEDRVRKDLLAVDALVREIAGKHNVEIEKVYSLLASDLKAKKRSHNPWPWYETYFAEYEEQELRRHYGSTYDLSTVSRPIGQNIRSACYELFKQAYSETWEEILRTYHEKVIMEKGSDHTVHQRHRAFQHYTQEIQDAADRMHRQWGIETGWIAVGSNAHNDDRNSAIYETKYLSGFLLRMTRVADLSELKGHARGTAMYNLSEETVQMNFQTAEGGSSGTSGHPSGDGNHIIPDLRPVDHPTKPTADSKTDDVANLSDEESLIYIKDQLDRLFAPFDWVTTPLAKKYIPWQTLPTKLADWRLRLTNWPNGIPCPGGPTGYTGQASKGVSVLKLEERRALARAFLDETQPIQVERIEEEDTEDGYIVVIQGAAPCADAEHERGLRIIVKESNHKIVRHDRQGLPRRSSTPQRKSEHPITQPRDVQFADGDHTAAPTTPKRGQETISSDTSTTPIRPTKKRRLNAAHTKLVVKLPATSKPKKPTKIQAPPKRQDFVDLTTPPAQRKPSSVPRQRVVVELPSRSKSRIQKKTTTRKESDVQVREPDAEGSAGQRAGGEKGKGKGKERADDVFDADAMKYDSAVKDDLIAPMLRGTSHKVKPRPVRDADVSRLPSAVVANNDSGEVTSSVAHRDPQATPSAMRPAFTPDDDAVTQIQVIHTSPMMQAPIPPILGRSVSPVTPTPAPRAAQISTPAIAQAPVAPPAQVPIVPIPQASVAPIAGAPTMPVLQGPVTPVPPAPLTPVAQAPAALPAQVSLPPITHAAAPANTQAHLRQVSAYDEGQLTRSGHPGPMQYHHNPMLPMHAYPAAQNMHFPPHLMTPYMHQWMPQGSGAAAAGLMQMPQVYPPYVAGPPFAMNAMGAMSIEHTPFGSLPSGPNAAMPFGQPVAGSSNTAGVPPNGLITAVPFSHPIAGSSNTAGIPNTGMTTATGEFFQGQGAGPSQRAEGA